MVNSFALHREALIARNGVGPLPSDSESPILPLYERAENIPKQRVEPCPTASHAVMLPLHHVGDENEASTSVLSQHHSVADCSYTKTGVEPDFLGVSLR